MERDNKGKKSVRKKTVKEITPKQSASWRSCLVLGIGAIIIAAYFYVVRQEATEIPVEHVEKYTMEKTSDGVNVDFTEKTKQIHRAVDQVLAKHQATVLDTKQADKSVNKRPIESNIKWNTRTMPVAIAAEQIETVKSELTITLDKIDAQILQSASDQYQGQSVIRIDIGVQDTLEGDSVTVIADRLYMIEKQTNFLGQSSQAKNGMVKEKAKLALIIDDFDYSKAPIDAYAKIHAPLTFAISPHRWWNQGRAVSEVWH